MKVKMFVGGSPVLMQREINEWLSNNPVEIVIVAQSESNAVDLKEKPSQFNWGVTVSIWYR